MMVLGTQMIENTEGVLLRHQKHPLSINAFFEAFLDAN